MNELTLNQEKIELIFNKGFQPNKFLYLWLCSINDKEIIEKFNAAISVDLLTFQYIDINNRITKKGQILLEGVLGKQVVSNKVDNKKDLLGLREKLQDYLLKNHGKKQVKGFGDVYFVPTEMEIIEFFKRFWKDYPNLTDMVKITKILEQHIVKCSKRNSFAPAIKYFIYKVGTGSQLASAYDNFEEKSEEKEIDTQPKETKNLF